MCRGDTARPEAASHAVSIAAAETGEPVSDRVSDGLLAELQRKLDDGTPRGIVWPALAQIAIAAAACVSNEEEAVAANEAIANLILWADEKALTYIEMHELLNQLADYQERKENP